MNTLHTGKSARLRRLASAAFALAFALATLTLLGAGARPAAAYAAGLAAGSVDSATAVRAQDASSYEYLDADKNISLNGRTAGTASYNAATKTITLNGVTAKTLSIRPEGSSFTLVLNGSSSLDDLFSYSSVTVKGSGKLAVSDALSAFDDSVLTMTQGTVSGYVQVGKLVMKGGAITGSGTSAKISSRNGIVMSGGTISLSSPKYTGITVSKGDFTMSGGTLSVTNAGSYGIDVSNFATSSSPNTGKISITGGSVSITVATPTSSYAMSAASMSNNLGSLKTIRGRLPYGAKFYVGKNLYQVMKTTSYVQLVKYNSAAKKAKVNKAPYGGYAYEVGGIGAGAFSTSAGKKVTSIAINSYITQIGAKAFAGTKSLKTLAFRYTSWIKRVYTSKYTLKSLKVYAGCTIAKKAFAKCGKGGGKQLTVKLGKSGVWSKEAAKYKRFLKSKGMPGTIRLKTY